MPRHAVMDASSNGLQWMRVVIIRRGLAAFIKLTWQPTALALNKYTLAPYAMKYSAVHFHFTRNSTSESSTSDEWEN